MHYYTRLRLASLHFTALVFTALHYTLDLQFCTTLQYLSFHNLMFDFTALDEWIDRFENECEDFIDEYGYDEYLRYYCISTYEIDEEFEGGEDYSEVYDDENFDGSDEEY